jgi:hypothetical protein
LDATWNWSGRLNMAQRGTTAPIDLVELERLSALQCTDEEIAFWFGVTTRTIERRRKDPKFAEVMERGKAKGRISVRRMQMKLLEQGNATMGVWLGKQILGQTDEVRHEFGGTAFLQINIPAIPPSYSYNANAPRALGVARQLIEASKVQEGGAQDDDDTENV